jgi:hypothetical protein
VNKQRAQSGETKSRSTSGTSAASAKSGTTFRELYAEAQRRDIKGRSSMDKAQLERALSRASGGKRGSSR